MRGFGSSSQCLRRQHAARRLVGVARGLLGIAMVVALAFTSPNAAHAGPSSPEHLAPGWAVQRYGTDDGLDARGITDLDLDPDGRLWLASFNGLMRFDGFHFEHFPRRRYPGLPSDRVIDLYRLADGDLWLYAENRHIARWNGVDFDLPLADATKAPEAVRRTRMDAAGGLWVADRTALFQVRSGRLTQVCRLPDGVELLNFALGGDLQHPNVWISAMRGGVWRCSSGRAAQVQAPELAALGDIETLAEERGGALVLATGQQLVRWAEGRVSDVALSDAISGEALRSGVILGNETDGTVVLSSDEGVFRLGTGQAQRLLPASRAKTGRFNRLHRAEDGAVWRFLGPDVYRDDAHVFTAPRRVTQLATDREGGVFVATDGAGLMRLRPTPLTVVRPIGTDGIHAFTALTPLREKASTFLAATLAGERYQITRESEGRMQIQALPGSRQVLWSLLQTGDGRLWEGGDYLCVRRGAACDDDPVPLSLRRDAGLRGDIRMLFEDGAGRLWVGSALGVFRHQHGDWQRIEGAPSQTLRVVLEMPDGTLLFGSNGAGLWRFDGKHMIAVDGLPNGLVRSLHLAADGWLYIGSEDLGLIRARLIGEAGRWHLADLQRIDRSDGLPDDAIHQILPGDDGALWINSNRGVFRFEPQQWAASMASGEGVPLPLRLFDARDGLIDAEGNGGFHAAGFRDADGRLWFPAQGMVIGVEPARFHRLPPPLPPRFRLATAAGDALPDPGTIAAGQSRSVRVLVDSPRFSDPERLLFRHRFAGAAWSTPGREREWLFQQLPAGDMRLQVQVAAAGGPWIDAGHEWTLAIRPRFTETPAFSALLGLAMVLSGMVLWWWRSAALRRRARHLEQMVALRTDELREQKQRVEESLHIVERQRRELAVLDEAKSRFFTDLSHELRTPLTLILGPAEQAMSDVEQGSRIGRSLRSIHGNAGRLLELVNQILELARLESGVYRPSPQSGDLLALMHGTLDAFRVQATERGVELRLESNVDSALADFDADALRRILSNLLGNALRHTSSDSRIALVLTVGDDGLVFDVDDQGPGIAEDEREQIFERYYSRAKGGSGIGLALARELARVQGGDLVALAAPEGGARLRCTLPLQVERTSAPVVVDVPSPALPLEAEEVGDSARAVVLVVEDQPDVLTFLRECLGTQFDVLCAADGDAGLAMARQHLPDAVVTDLVMPGRDGLSLVRAMQDDAEMRTIPVIILSARDAEATQLAGIESGAVEYLTKPFSPALLRARLHRLLGFRMQLRDQLRGEFERMAVAEQHAPVDSLESRVRRAILRHLGEPGFGVDQLAAALLTSRSSLKRALQEAGLSSPSALIREIRLEQALRLLGQRRSGIAEIAYAVGYASQSHFSTRFREQYGITPAEWLRREPEPE